MFSQQCVQFRSVYADRGIRQTRRHTAVRNRDGRRRRRQSCSDKFTDTFTISLPANSVHTLTLKTAAKGHCFTNGNGDNAVPEGSPLSMAVAAGLSFTLIGVWQRR